MIPNIPSALPRSFRTVSVWVAILSAAVVTTGSAVGDSGDSPAFRGPDDETRQLLEKWVETRRVISKEKQDWALGREVMQDRISLVGQEVDQALAVIAEAKKSREDLESQLSELQQEAELAEAGAAELEAIIEQLEARTRDLLPGLPAPVLKEVSLLTQNLEDAIKVKDLGLSTRYRNVVGTLNAINKFHTAIHEVEETREDANGTSRVIPSCLP